MAESREDTAWPKEIHAEQIRVAAIVAGLQRDIGDLVTNLAVQGGILRGTDGGPSLVVRMAINEQKLSEMKDDLLDHRRATEVQMDRVQDTLEKVRENSEQQIRDAATQRAQHLIQVVGWILGVIAMVLSAMFSLFKK